MREYKIIEGELPTEGIDFRWLSRRARPPPVSRVFTTYELWVPAWGFCPKVR